MGRQIQKAILITGDSDFIPAIEVSRESGVVVTLYYFPKTCGDELYKAVDERHEIDASLLGNVIRKK